MTQLQARLRDASSQEHHVLLKQELAKRDDAISRLRREVLALQEKRDHVQAQVPLPSPPDPDEETKSVALCKYHQSETSKPKMMAF